MTDAVSLTPQQKLAVSRKALLRLMTRDERAEAGGPDAGADQPGAAPVKEGSAFSAMSYAIQTWWRYHPAHALFDVGRPLFDRYAARRPLQVIGIAAAVGAAAVLVRPWRLVSIGGLLVAAFKSASAPGVLLSMLSTRPSPPSAIHPKPGHK